MEPRRRRALALLPSMTGWGACGSRQTLCACAGARCERIMKPSGAVGFRSDGKLPAEARRSAGCLLRLGIPDATERRSVKEQKSKVGRQRMSVSRLAEVFRYGLATATVLGAVATIGVAHAEGVLNGETIR